MLDPTRSRIASLFCVTLAAALTGCNATVDDLAELNDVDQVESSVSLQCGETLSVTKVLASAEEKQNPATNVLDANLATRWSGLGVGTHLTATLGAPSRICRIGVAWYRGNLRQSHFVLSVSSDGVTFTDVYAADSSGTTSGVESYTLSAPVVAQYVRLTVNGNTENKWASVTELRISGASDITAPDTQVKATLTAADGSDLSFGLTSTESGSTFECRLDGATWAACTSPKAYADLAPGTHLFEARATDASGNVDGSPAQYRWSIAAPKVSASSLGGFVKPGPSNTGIPAGTTLTRLDGNQVIDQAWMDKNPTGVPAGAGRGVMQNVDIYGTVTIKVPNFTLRRSRVRGKQQQLTGGEWTALVWVTVGSSTGSPTDVRSTVVIEDCEISPTYPSAGSTGIYGYNFTARRNNIHRTVDGFGLWWFTHVESNWVHDLSFFDFDGGHSDGTHNDVVQLHNLTTGPVAGAGGYNTIVGNFFQAFIAQDVGTPEAQLSMQYGVLGKGFDHQAMSVFMVNKNFKNTVTDNWMEGGYYPVNGGDGANAGQDLGTWKRNRFDRMRYDNPGASYGTGGSYDVSPRYTLVFKSGSVVDTGAGTADANRFSAQPVTPGITADAEVKVRFY